MYLLLKRIKIPVEVRLRVSCQEICRCMIPRLCAVDIRHDDIRHDLSTYFMSGNQSSRCWRDLDCQQPPQVSRATWSVFCFVDLTKPRNSSSETARMNRALQQELRNAPSLKPVGSFHSIAEKLRKDTA